MKSQNTSEEKLKNKIAKDYFWQYDCSKIVGNVDFCVCVWKDNIELSEQESLLWAEAKKGYSDIYRSITQLILTIGKARTFDKILPPSFLSAFDSEKIAFLPYNTIQYIFYQNDFNWNVTPSNTDTKEFKQVYEKVKSIIDDDTLVFYYEKYENKLKNFIKNNFIIEKFGVTKTSIDKNNFITIYNKWYETVKPTIAVNWDKAKKNGIIDGDFYLADLLSSDNQTIMDKLFVLLKSNHCVSNKRLKKTVIFSSDTAEFNDNQKAHTLFWNKYERPPLKDYWDYIVNCRNLLVPQDIRERKGSFYTPRIWVELSQKYLADVFGKDWQDKYYIWDCAAGTGNLLAGLVNKDRIFASTLDKSDVDIMHQRIQNGANLLESHVFQFDFLNDDFSKLPQALQDIINDPKRREKLIIYINPPYAEAMNKRDTKNAKTDINRTLIEKKYLEIIGKSVRELYVQFLTRIYSEISGSIIANFSTLKFLQAPNCLKFRRFFRAKLTKLFIVPADTFDNVSGQFPIGFFIWNTSPKKIFSKIKVDVFDKNAKFIYKKTIFSYDKSKFINDWLKQFADKNIEKEIAAMCCIGNDFQHNIYVNINHSTQLKGVGNAKGIAKFRITVENIIQSSVYFAVRQCICHTWLNDRDQFLYPNKKWEKDIEFHNNCLTYTLFNNNISSKHGVNHWIPFSEKEVSCKIKFESHFMFDFINGKLVKNEYSDLFEQQESKMCITREFSPEATAVFNAGRELWKYYHTQPNINVNASLYDIKEYFQGRNENGKMKNKSEDSKYNELMKNLRESLEILTQKIEPKVYEYEFLR